MTAVPVVSTPEHVSLVVPDHDDDGNDSIEGIRFVDYVDESQLEDVMSLVGRDLSEPYSSAYSNVFFHMEKCTLGQVSYFCDCASISVFTYRFFLHRFPKLCILAVNEDGEAIGCVVGKIDEEELNGPVMIPNPLNPPPNDLTECEAIALVGYIGMLAVSSDYRRRGIGKALVQRILRRMRSLGCTSATLETEVTNVSAQRLYQECFGFIREELLVRYYLNWNDAYRLRLWF
jgi:N-alpha-acetyltransferase 30